MSVSRAARQSIARSVISRRPKQSLRERWRRWVLLATAVAVPAATLMSPTASMALPYNWDPALSGTATGGGTGTWDLTTMNWFDPVATTDVVWPNTLDLAIFGGTGGTVSLGVAGIQANGLTFNVGGYTIDNGGNAANILTLGGATPTITVTNATDTATISAVLAGTTLNTAGGRDAGSQRGEYLHRADHRQHGRRSEHSERKRSRHGRGGHGRFVGGGPADAGEYHDPRRRPDAEWDRHLK